MPMNVNLAQNSLQNKISKSEERFSLYITLENEIKKRLPSYNYSIIKCPRLCDGHMYYNLYLTGVFFQPT